MPKYLKDTSTESLIEAIVLNNREIARLFAGAPGVEVDLAGDVGWFISGVPYPLFNMVLKTDLQTDRVDEMITDTLARFQRRNLPFLWIVDPSSRPHDLGERLKVAGLRHGGDSPGMAVNLDSLSFDSAVPPDLTIHAVREKEDLSSWCDVVAQSFQMPGFARDALFDFMARLSRLGFPDIENYVAKREGEVAAVSTVVYAHGVAGIYNVGTRPDMRRRGYGMAITLATLLEARNAGYRVGVLQSSEMGLNIYKRVGFEEVCTFGQYLWLPP
jgi:ribosomal protein S18 acetylase RimI-like enzyme